MLCVLSLFECYFRYLTSKRQTGVFLATLTGLGCQPIYIAVALPVAGIGNPFKYHASGILSTQAPDLTTMCSALSPDSSDNISPTSNKTIPNTTNIHGGVAGVFNVTERVTKSDGNWVA